MMPRSGFSRLATAPFIQGPVGSRPLLAGLLIGLTLWACGGGEPTSPGEEEAAISFLRTRSRGFADLFVVAASGAGLTQLLDSTGVHKSYVTYARVSHPYEWSPDGEKLAFAFINESDRYPLGSWMPLAACSPMSPT